MQLIARADGEPDLPFFKPSPEASTNGTSLAMTVQEPHARIIESFESARREDGVYEPLRGYDGNAWTFEDSDGRVVNCYRRWGTMRIGSHSDGVASSFLEFIGGMGES